MPVVRQITKKRHVAKWLRFAENSRILVNLRSTCRDLFYYSHDPDRAARIWRELHEVFNGFFSKCDDLSGAQLRTRAGG
jgi:hypothetical protein